MPKEDFTEREIRKIRQLLMFLLKMREDNNWAEVRDKLNEIAEENEFPDFNSLLQADPESFEGIISGLKQNAVVAELYFQLMELEAEACAESIQQRKLYAKALALGLLSEKLDRTYSPGRNAVIEKIRKKLAEE